MAASVDLSSAFPATRDGTLMRDYSEQTEEPTRGRRVESTRTPTHRPESLWLPPAGWWLLVVACAEAGMELSILLPIVFRYELRDGRGFVPALVGVLLVPVVLHAAWRLGRQHHNERAKAIEAAHLMDTVVSTCDEWLWAIGADGRFTFCSPMTRELLGYEPSELLGRHWSVVTDFDAPATAWPPGRDPDAPEAAWTGLAAIRHRDGTAVQVEVCVRARLDGAGRNFGYAGSTRLLDRQTGGIAAEKVRDRIEALLTNRTMLTAFQPIRRLDTGDVIGVEALTRFTGPPIQSPEAWFADAASVGRGPELEFLAMETALEAAARLPTHLYVSVNLSPEACLDPRLNDIVQNSQLQAGRIVLELTERTAVADYEHLRTALARPRDSGLRIAVDDACAGFASMRHILQLKPELIKLDRHIVAGIDANHGQRTLVTAMVKFGTGIGAALIAEGIETDTELDTVTELGINAGQGYLLGQPSVHPEEWGQWQNQAPGTGDPSIQAWGLGTSE
jgi:PAS domain S-box-containing protein